MKTSSELTPNQRNSFALVDARHYENHMKNRGMLCYPGYVIQQNNCVCANQSGMCTCTHKIIYHRAFTITTHYLEQLCV